MFIQPTQILDSTQDGDMTYTNFSATDEAGNLVFCRIGHKGPKYAPQVGVDIEIEGSPALSQSPNDHTYVRRAKSGKFGGGGGGGRPQNSPQNAQRAPQSHANTGGQAKAVPTMSQAVAVLRECIEAVHGFGTDAHATTLFLARLRGDIRRDPTSAEIEQAKAEAARKAEEAAKEAERLAAEAAKQQALANAGYTAGSADDDDSIPF